MCAKTLETIVLHKFPMSELIGHFILMKHGWLILRKYANGYGLRTEMVVKIITENGRFIQNITKAKFDVKFK